MTINIETDLKEVLTKIETKLDTVIQDVSEIKTDVAVVKANQDNMKDILREVKNKQDGLINDVSDLKGAKSLIIPIVVAVITSITTLLIRAIPLN